MRLRPIAFIVIGADSCAGMARHAGAVTAFIHWGGLQVGGARCA